MSVAIAKVERVEAELFYGFEPDRVALLTRTIAKGLTTDELGLFLSTAQRLGLDPFAKQIYAVKRGGVMTLQVAIDGFRAVADRTGHYAPGRESTFEEKNGQIVSATAYVKKLVAGQWHEIAEKAYFAEYSAGGNFWSKMPHAMISKVAEARALRRAFPSHLSGVYSAEEMDQADNDGPAIPATVAPKFAPPPQALPSPTRSNDAPAPPLAAASGEGEAIRLQEALLAAESLTDLKRIAAGAKGVTLTTEEQKALRAIYDERAAALRTVLV